MKDHEQDWGECNTTSLDEQPASLAEQKFCCHRMFVIAYVLIALVAFGYICPHAAQLNGPALTAYWTGAMLCYLTVMIFAIFLHVVAIFDLTVNHYTKD